MLFRASVALLENPTHAVGQPWPETAYEPRKAGSEILRINVNVPYEVKKALGWFFAWSD
jgi:hypothetical protein